MDDFDILYFIKDIRLEMGAKTFRGNKLYPAVDQFFEQKGQVHKIIEGFLSWLKFNQYIHIAIRFLFFTNKRSKNP